MTDILAKPFVETRLEDTRPALKWGLPIALIVVSMITGWWLTGGPSLDLNVPLINQVDGLLILIMIKRVMEGTWLFHSDLMGAPFGSYLYDYPIPDSRSLFILKWLGKIFGSSLVVAFNLYYLFGFPLNFTVSEKCLRSPLP